MFSFGDVACVAPQVSRGITSSRPCKMQTHTKKHYMKAFMVVFLKSNAVLLSLDSTNDYRSSVMKSIITLKPTFHIGIQYILHLVYIKSCHR